jgi:integrase
MSWQHCITDYTISLRAGGCSAGTITTYRHYLNYAADRLCGDPWAATTQQLERLIGSPEWGPSGRKSLRTALGGFYRWGRRYGYVVVDPVAELPTPKVPKGKPRPAPEGVIRDALERADARERLMVELGALAGLRAGEISRAHSDDLVEDVLLVHGKGGKLREVPIADGHLLTTLHQGAGWLFPNRQRGGHITPNHVSKLLSRLLPAPWTGHTLRHRFGTRAYAGSRDLLAVSQLLGHSSTDTTLIYVRMPDDHLRAAVQAAATIGAVAPLPRPTGPADGLSQAA